ncbi:MAG: hypothetical protein HC904_08575 [Blastochloris sp.]|nr:hypothetical protein [Blastochloris sp.]
MNKKWNAIVGLMLLVTCPAMAQTFDWNLNNAGSWSLDSNWNGTPPVGGPDAADITVNITNNITAARTVSILTRETLEMR